MLTDLRKFYFYQKYTWNPTDFENFETWLWGAIEGLQEGAFGAAVLKGGRPRAGGGMTLLIDALIACNAVGRIVASNSQLNTTIASPAGNPARTLVVARPKSTNATLIPEPMNPSNMVPLHEKLEWDLIVLNGTPAATPAYPATQAGDIVLAGLKLNASHATITEADLDWGVIDRPRKRKQRVKKVTAGVSVVSGDSIIEANFASASGIVLLAPPGDVEGEKFTIVKEDSSANVCAVSGDISGQSVVELDTQWQSITVYSNGISYRSI